MCNFILVHEDDELDDGLKSRQQSTRVMVLQTKPNMVSYTAQISKGVDYIYIYIQTSKSLI